MSSHCKVWTWSESEETTGNKIKDGYLSLGANDPGGITTNPEDTRNMEMGSVQLVWYDCSDDFDGTAWIEISSTGHFHDGANTKQDFTDRSMQSHWWVELSGSRKTLSTDVGTDDDPFDANNDSCLWELADVGFEVMRGRFEVTAGNGYALFLINTKSFAK